MLPGYPRGLVQMPFNTTQQYGQPIGMQPGYGQIMQAQSPLLGQPLVYSPQQQMPQQQQMPSGDPREAFRQQRHDWRAARPDLAGMMGPERRQAMQDWRGMRPQRNDMQGLASMHAANLDMARKPSWAGRRGGY